MKLKKIIFATNIGTLLEWAEFTFFAYMADQLSSLFFADNNLYLARLKTYSIFATSYLMRPIGAIIFGYIGDKYGRKPAMLGSLLLMSIATFCIGILPTYSSIGILAAVLLMLFRMLQGIAVAGEFNGAAILLTEHATQNRYLAGSWTACAAAAGMAIGSSAAAITASVNIPWFWRVPFLISSLLAVVAMYLRRNMQETPVFQQAKQEKKLFISPLRAAWKHNKQAMLCTAGFSLFISVFVYTGSIYYKSILVRIGHLDPTTSACIVTIGMILATICMPLAAIIADKTNGYKVCLTGLLLSIILCPFMMYCARTGNIMLSLTGQVIYAILDALVSATLFTVLLEKFATGNKYSGSSFAWSITTAIFGGSSLLINEILVVKYKLINGPGLYIALSAIICSLIVILTSKTQISNK